MRKEHRIIRTCSKDNKDFETLYYIFRDTIRPDMSFPKFIEYYNGEGLEFISVSFLYNNDCIAGFAAAAFYKTTIGKKKYTIGRAAIGILPRYQGGAFSSWHFFSKYLWYKCTHPLQHLVITAYVANPIVYAMICKYTAYIYPRLTTEVPEKIIQLKNNILRANGLQQQECNPFAVPLEFAVTIGSSVKKRIAESSNMHVQFFSELTGMLPKVYLLVIIPFRWLNIFLSVCCFIFYKNSKWIKSITPLAKKYKEKETYS